MIGVTTGSTSGARIVRHAGREAILLRGSTILCYNAGGHAVRRVAPLDTRAAGKTGSVED